MKGAEVAPPLEGRRIISRPAPEGGWFLELKTTEHQCPLPQEWTLGAIWQCPEGHLWVVRAEPTALGVVRLAWWPASWWQRRRFGPGMKRAWLLMIDPRRRAQGAQKPEPPKGPGGVSS